MQEIKSCTSLDQEKNTYSKRIYKDLPILYFACCYNSISSPFETTFYLMKVNCYRNNEYLIYLSHQEILKFLCTHGPKFRTTQLYPEKEWIHFENLNLQLRIYKRKSACLTFNLDTAWLNTDFYIILCFQSFTVEWYRGIVSLVKIFKDIKGKETSNNRTRYVLIYTNPSPNCMGLHEVIGGSFPQVNYAFYVENCSRHSVIYKKATSVSRSPKIASDGQYLKICFMFIFENSITQC